MNFERLSIFISIVIFVVFFIFSTYASQNHKETFKLINKRITNVNLKENKDPYKSNLKVVLQGNWGNSQNEIGVKLIEDKILPNGPFMGPGGFRVDENERIFISDSINNCIKIFNSNQISDIIKVKATYLGDIDTYKNCVYVVTKNPDGIAEYDLQTKAQKNFFNISFGTPGRILVVNDQLILLEDFTGKIWAVINNKVYEIQLSTLEPVADSNFIFGISIDLEPTQRKILVAKLLTNKELNNAPTRNNKYNGTNIISEPRQFCVLKEDSNILYAKLMGLMNSTPIIIYIKANNEKKYNLVFTDRHGNITSRFNDIPILSGCWMPSYWILSKDFKSLFGFESDTQGFKVLKLSLN